MPIVTRIVTTREFDPVATAKSFLGPPWKWGKKYSSTDEEILERAKIFDQFMQMDNNFQTVPAAQCIRITNFQPVLFDTTLGDGDEPHQLPVSGDEFFDGGHIDNFLWETYAKILGYVGDNSVYDMLDYYYKGRLIAEWDDIFYNDMLPLIFARITDSIAFTKGTVKVEPIETLGQPGTYRMVYEDNGPTLDVSTGAKYTGGNKSINVNFSGTYSGSRRNLSEADDYLGLLCTNDDVLVLKNHIKLNIGSVSIDYTTDYFQGSLYRGHVNDDLLDGTNLYIPLTQRDETSPRKEDIYIANTLIEHLNSNIEHYNKVLWTNLDSDRRYMLLDGFHIQTYAANGDLSVMRSLASVVKNQLISIAGNSLVFPVADGYRVGRDSMLQEAEETGSVDTSLLDYYKPLTPMKPYRLSVPTRGVFMEAIQGNCDACEMVKENSSQDWDKFRTEEPTTISPVVTPTPTVTEYRPDYKDFASPVVNIQNAPDAPAPAAGLSQLGELLGKSDVFKDITGLEGNQKNVLETFKANTQAAQEYAKMASSLATQQHNTQHSPDITDRIEQARSGGSITDEDARNLTRQHLQQQIEGGEASREAAEFSREQGRTSLSDVAANAANRGQSVEAERTGPDGINERIQIGGDGNSDIVNIVRQVQSLSQEKNRDCWAVAATIMMNWKSNTTSTVEDVLRIAGFSADPENEEYYLEIHNADNGLLATEKDQFINSIGMDAQPPANFTAEAYINWLETFGPLWITGDDDTGAGFSPHARILYQINGDRNDLDNLIFHFIDPSNGESIAESFTTFVSRFEQIVTDIGSSSSVLFSQVVMFTSSIPSSAQEAVGEGQSVRGNTRIIPSSEVVQWASLRYPSRVRSIPRLANHYIDVGWHPESATTIEFLYSENIDEFVERASRADIVDRQNSSLRWRMVRDELVDRLFSESNISDIHFLLEKLISLNIIQLGPGDPVRLGYWLFKNQQNIRVEAIIFSVSSSLGSINAAAIPHVNRIKDLYEIYMREESTESGLPADSQGLELFGLTYYYTRGLYVRSQGQAPRPQFDGGQGAPFQQERYNKAYADFLTAAEINDPDVELGVDSSLLLFPNYLVQLNEILEISLFGRISNLGQNMPFFSPMRVGWIEQTAIDVAEQSSSQDNALLIEDMVINQAHNMGIRVAPDYRGRVL
jgi:hypothetical protein